ncbi:MAG: unnamed protein product [Candidatus Burkholderia crenata]|nr:MAG: unnamed protein product [Candidatus Burkholderia crenata]
MVVWRGLVRLTDILLGFEIAEKIWVIVRRQLANIAGTPYGIKPKMIAKIERAEAIPVLQGILDASDGIMVARGDPRGGSG